MSCNIVCSTFLLVALCTLSTLGDSRAAKKSIEYDARPIVHLGSPYQVSFQGISVKNVESFLNIRFGQDTSSSNRFAHPKPFTYPQGSVVDASQFGVACPQQKVPIPTFPIFDNVTNFSEDCLTLRVDRHSKMSHSTKLPVMVYIYGGGDAVGQIYDSAYDPTMLLAGAFENSLPIIYVAMNYRLGIFGFASSPALNATDSLNSGLLDQRLALHWVQEHISAFGGDPDNVTIFGESEGATAVGLHITAYGGKEAKPPFKRAIMQSGAPTADTGTTSNISAIRTEQFIQKVNCTSLTSSEELACLREIPLSTFLGIALEYALSINSFSGFGVFFPTSPSTFIPDSPSNLLYSGQFSCDIDIMTGWNEDDGTLFVPTTFASDSDVASWLASSKLGMSPKSIQDALALYPVSSFPDNSAQVTAQYFRAAQMQRDLEFTCPSLLMVQSNVRKSAKVTSNYLFSLNQTIFAKVYAAEGASYYGVSHISDVPFVFNQASTKYAASSSPSDIKLSTQISNSWASFATYGDPLHGNATLLGWTDAILDADTHDSEYELLVIGGPDGGRRKIGSGSSDYEDVLTRCNFWNSETLLQQLRV